MQFNDMEEGFRHAFSAAISAYRRGSTAIGCAIMNGDGECIAQGENSIYAADSKEKINRHHLAHAEINAILKVGSGGYGDKTYENILYTTMEPCVMCFGAIVMCYYKNVKFAAIDPYGGAVKLNEQNDYGISIEGPFDGLQELQVALSVFRGLKTGLGYVNKTIEMYHDICGHGVEVGQKLFDDEEFNRLIDDTSGLISAETVISYMLEELE